MPTLCTSSTSTNGDDHTAKFQFGGWLSRRTRRSMLPLVFVRMREPTYAYRLCRTTLRPFWHNMFTCILCLSGSHLQVVALRNCGLVLGVSVNLCRPVTTRVNAGPQQPVPLGSLISWMPTAISTRCPGLGDQVDATDSTPALPPEVNDLCSPLRTYTRSATRVLVSTA